MIPVTFIYDSINYIILIGNNKYENFKIIDESIDSDIWFHIQDEPSAHIVLKTTNKLKDIPKQVIKRCAYLCKINSKAKTEKKSTVIYTQIQNVIKTEIVGKVEVSSYKSVTV